MAMTTLLLDLPAGSALSNPLQIPPNLKIARIGMPSGWTTAPLTFQISAPADTQVVPDDADWLDLHHAQQSVTGEWVPYVAIIPQVIPNTSLLLPPDAGANIGWLKIRSGTRSQPVNQEADRTFAIVFG